MKLSGSDCIEDYISLHDNSKPSLISRKIRDSFLFSNSPLDTTRDRRELENSWILSYFRKFKVEPTPLAFSVTFGPDCAAPPSLKFRRAGVIFDDLISGVETHR